MRDLLWRSVLLMACALCGHLHAIDEERALDVAAVTMPARWPDAYARAVDQRDAAHARVQVTEATLRRIAEPISEDGR